MLEAAIIVTYRCNARCAMCDIWQHPTKPEEEFPADLVDAYVHGKKHGLTLTRYTAGSARVAEAGRVAFEVGTSVGCVVNEDHTPW